MVFRGFFCIFAPAMNRLRYFFVRLSRLRHSRGFGIQSPTDFRFVRDVICESWPYHSYSSIGLDDDWLRRKLGQLYFRLVNNRQPMVVVDWLNMGDYLQAGCRKAKLVKSADKVEMAFLPLQIDYQGLFDMCDENSVVVFQDIWRNMPLWHCIEYDTRVSVTFDLYFCGIVLFDKKRARQNYKVNF